MQPTKNVDVRTIIIILGVLNIAAAVPNPSGYALAKRLCCVGGPFGESCPSYETSCCEIAPTL